MVPYEPDPGRRPRPLRTGHRPGDPRRAGHRLEDVLRLLDRVRRRAQHAHLPGLPRPARRAPGRQREGDRVDDPDRPGAELLDRHVVPVRAQELLLPGHAEELPDVAVRRAALRGGLPGRRRGRADVPGGHRTGAPGGGHRQEHPRRDVRPHPRRRLLAGRLQPRRHPAGRDRHEAGDRHRAAGPRGRTGLRHRAARHPAHARRERRADGAGLAALRRQHLAEPSGAGVGHPDRDEERQLAALGRARGAIGDAAPGRGARRWRQDPAGDAALRGGQRYDPRGPLQGGGDRLPVLPGAGPRPDGAGPGLGRVASRVAARAAGRPAGTVAG